MHDDFYKMIGTLHAAAQFIQTRKPNGLPRRGVTPADVPTTATKLAAIADNLLKASFDYEVVENVFQEKWTALKGDVEKAAFDLVTADGSATVKSLMPVKSFTDQGQLVHKLNAEYSARFDMQDPGTGERAQDFIDLFNARLARAARARGWNAQSHSVQRTALTTVLDKLQTEVNLLLTAASRLADVFRAEATKFAGLKTILENLLGGPADQITGIFPWSGLDERLHSLLAFLLKSAAATRGGGEGGTSTPSWGSYGTSGSSSSSSGG